MQFNPDDLRRHYQSLSDDALSAVEREDLVEVAQKIYDEEIARRGFAASGDNEHDDLDDHRSASGLERHEFYRPDGLLDPPDWLQDAASACSFTSYSQSAPSDVEDGQGVLLAAGIPCYITMNPVEDPTRPQWEFSLMVPGALNLHATSVLDRDLFNPKQEADWRVLLETLSDADLRALDPKIFCAGFLDRAARLKRAYQDELARRGLK